MAKAVKQLTPRQVAARKNGSKGGRARAKNLSPEAMREIASQGGKRTHQKYGDAFFGFIAGRRKTIGRYRTAVLEA